eukprot:CAMPEP_0113546674 /NCGR_PEP_ID=MMETSP0015_2-20120614/11934_1 /TAXON_ID=2838 /ORGANISM="Odontella" /LENGTH=897 /DNA_ID=CAMNT_0000447149 /DNA_START=463 /DNA_END=3153 /DNA_ORIENTATION=- /assembly_acc=CAM_ASM_000160
MILYRRTLLIGAVLINSHIHLCWAQQQQQSKKSSKSVKGPNGSSGADISGNSHGPAVKGGRSSDDDVGDQSHYSSGQKVGSQRVSAEAMRQKWKKTFEEIKELVVENKSSSPSGRMDARHLLNRWKLFIEKDGKADISGWRAPSLKEGKSVGGDHVAGEGGATGDDDATDGSSRMTHAWKRSDRPRFDGFANWERRLQQWADETSEYVERSQQQLLDEWGTGGEYPFSTFGKPLERTVAAREKSRDEDEADLVAVDAIGAAINTTSAEEALLVSEVEREQDKVAPFSPRPVRPDEPVVPETDLGDKSKRVLIVTTASLPWMTGTAVNPLLRAAYMTTGRADAGGSVTLMLPWLERPSDRDRVYGKNRQFETRDEQEEYIRTWLRDTASMEQASEDLKIQWYTAWQNVAENSVYSMGDITALIPADEVDICILEEPEHLNWYRAPGESWTTKFKHVVGIVHTNYFVYAQEQPAALIRAPAMRLLCSWMCRAHCHRLVKLSGTLDVFAAEKELVENVHGVRGSFLEAGKELSLTLSSAEGKSHPIFGPEADPTVYFIGKMLWSKGIGSLMELLKYAEESAGLKVKVDMYGGGPDKDEADAKSKKLGLDMPFHGPIDHVKLAPSHKIFINPSVSEVLCTTVAEALAMGKFVIVPSHPSNDFFAQFPNCLTYANKEEFVGNLYYAFTHSPEPLSEEYSYALSWEAATERLEAAGSVSVAEATAMSHALSTPDAGVEIQLPPLIGDEERRRKVTNTIMKSRERYRQFRGRLSQEIKQSNVLPADLQQRLLKELDKRLDLDLDEVLQSPKLRLKLSPAELDKQLLEFYDSVTKGPRGDILRVIGGGNDVAMQDFYLKRQTMRENREKNELGPAEEDLFPSATFALPLLFDDITAAEDPSPTKW